MGLIAGATPIAAKQHRVTLETAGPRVSDGQGGYRESWVPLDPPTWNVEILTSATVDERIAGQSVQTAESVILRGDYRADVTTRTVIICRGRRLAVRGVDNPSLRNVDLVCDCEDTGPADAARAAARRPIGR